MLKRKMGDHQIFHDFRRGMPYTEIYEKYEIKESGLIHVLNHNIKGNYDYHRVLSSYPAQKQFLAHLKGRWNPLEPDAPYENISPYLQGSGIKTPVLNAEDNKYEDIEEDEESTRKNSEKKTHSKLKL